MDSFDSRLDGTLKKRARELGRLTALLRGELPPESDGHYHVANIRGNTLIIMTDSPVWTTRIRQLGPKILAVLQNSGGTKMQHVRVFSRPGKSVTIQPPPPETKPKHLSARSGQLISQTASFIDDDGLRDALLKLARRATVDREPGDKE